ncbi:thioesterase II family protein [Streptomyces vietnamensis]|uniref:thioesterase II family protein n=1 Tax=Streptomyces vietnamensis TaxID=362257 RepID=UPI00099C252D|nr:alpha/beta fold hydrolase [Streptomyces vietnamensis]
MTATSPSATGGRTLPLDHPGPWLRRYHGTPARAGATLVCFPHAGGSASFYYPYSEALSARYDVIAVQYPGRQDRHREPCMESVGELSRTIAAELAARVPADRPLAFFGHSMGAVVGFETARALERLGTGRAPDLFLASGRRAPALSRDDGIHRLPDRALLAELQKLGGTDVRMLDDPELFQLVVPTIRADFAAVETYRPEAGARVNCPVVALIGDVDPRVTAEQAAAWRDHTTADFALRVFSGGHFYLAERQREVIATLTAHIDPLKA